MKSHTEKGSPVEDAAKKLKVIEDRVIERLQQGDAGSAYSLIKSAVESGNDFLMALTPKTAVEIGKSFLMLGFPDYCAAWLEDVLKEPRILLKPEISQNALGWLGLAYVELGLSNKAESLYQVLSKDEEKAEGAYLFWARWLYHKDRKDGETAFQSRLEARGLCTRNQALALFERSQARFLAGDKERAAVDLRRAKQLSGLLGDRLLMTWVNKGLGRSDGSQAKRPPSLYFHMLGQFRVTRGGVEIPVSTWARKKASLLLQYLVLKPGWRCHRDQIIEDIWGEDQDPGVFHVTMHYLRQELQRGLLDPCNYVRLSKGIVSLDPSLVSGSDVSEYRALVKAGALNWDSERKVARDYYEKALDLWAGELLPESLGEIWLEPEREALHQMQVGILKRLAVDAETHGNQEKALALFLSLAEIEPSHEEAVAKIMNLLAGAGRTEKALDYYNYHANYLMSKLAMKPSRSLKTLLERLCRGKETDSSE